MICNVIYIYNVIFSTIIIHAPLFYHNSCTSVLSAPGFLNACPEASVASCCFVLGKMQCPLKPN